MIRGETLLITVSLLMSPFASAPQDPATPAPELPPGRPGDYFGVGSCSGGQCHGLTSPGTRFDILQTEFETWRNEDEFHPKAYAVLREDDSRTIARNLGLDEPAHESDRCLVCHALSVPSELQKRPIALENGISCESCHGPSGGWINDHSKEGWSHEQSVKNGLIDLRDLPTRVATCMRCHMGDETATVDHELLAAGHPETFFELNDFEIQMPSHWKTYRTLRDKEGRRETHDLRAWAVGQVEALRLGLEQLGRRLDGPHWPEFGEMTCTPCHHPLANERWKTIGGYTGRPGTATWNPARWVALEPLLAVLAPDERQVVARSIEMISAKVASFRPADAALERALADAGVALARASTAVDRAGLPPGVQRKVLDGVLSSVPESLDRQAAEQIIYAASALLVGTGNDSDEAYDALDVLFDDVADLYAFDVAAFRRDVELLKDAIQ